MRRVLQAVKVAKIYMTLLAEAPALAPLTINIYPLSEGVCLAPKHWPFDGGDLLTSGWGLTPAG